MRELTENEVSEVSGGIIPIVGLIIGIDIGLNGLLLAYASWASSNYRANN